MTADDPTALARRGGLPEDMQALIRAFPRATWAGRTGPFTAFWLERHELFRRLLAAMTEEVQGFVDGARDETHFTRVLSRYGSMFLGELSGHHQIEDAHYFPRFQRLDPRAVAAIDLLETDHDAIHHALMAFETGARAALSGPERRDAAGAFLDTLAATERLTLRHLADEEDIVVPLMLHHGEAALGH